MLKSEDNALPSSKSTVFFPRRDRSHSLKMGDNKLDIEETNRIRLSLGMQPLPTSSSTSNGVQFKVPTKISDESSDSESEEDTLDSRQAAGFDNWKKLQDEEELKKKQASRRAALKKQREAAQRFGKLEGKGLGEGDEEEVDTKSWLLGSSKRQKKITKERARRLEQELAERENHAQYTEKDLAGARVGHEMTEFDELGEQVLTLKDAAVDDEEGEDELENAVLREKEKIKERTELKKRKPAYDPNDAAESRGSILAQYDEEIDGKQRKRFTLNGAGGSDRPNVTRGEDKSAAGPLRAHISLDILDDRRPVSDYQDASEIKIKKPKKKKEKSKRRKNDDDDMFAPSEALNASKMDIPEDNLAINDKDNPPKKRKLEESSIMDDDDLQANLAAQRRAALKKQKKTRPEDLARQLREEAANSPEPTKEEPAEEEPIQEEKDEGMLVDETSDFVTNLQKEEALKPVRPRAETQRKEQEEHYRSPSAPGDDDDADVDMDDAYASATFDNQEPKDEDDAKEAGMTETGLQDEATLSTGIGSTLNLLTQRGLLKTAASGDFNSQYRERQRFLHQKQQRETEAQRKARLQREADRASGRFANMNRSERDMHAQRENAQRDQQDSRQMAEIFNREYKPNVDLKYVDEFGRHMDQKEAFKHMSHQFHGKGSGKQKTEKRLKKIEDEKKRMAQSSLDSSQSTGMGRAMGSQAKKNRQAGVRLQ